MLMIHNFASWTLVLDIVPATSSSYAVKHSMLSSKPSLSGPTPFVSHTLVTLLFLFTSCAHLLEVTSIKETRKQGGAPRTQTACNLSSRCLLTEKQPREAQHKSLKWVTATDRQLMILKFTTVKNFFLLVNMGEPGSRQGQIPHMPTSLHKSSFFLLPSAVSGFTVVSCGRPQSLLLRS